LPLTQNTLIRTPARGKGTDRPAKAPRASRRSGPKDHASSQARPQQMRVTRHSAALCLTRRRANLTRSFVRCWLSTEASASLVDPGSRHERSPSVGGATNASRLAPGLVGEAGADGSPSGRPDDFHASANRAWPALPTRGDEAAASIARSGVWIASDAVASPQRHVQHVGEDLAPNAVRGLFEQGE
jgi:hypothetical protein